MMNRNQVKKEDQWDLSKLFASEEEWEQAFKAFGSFIKQIASLKGTLNQNIESLAKVLELHTRAEQALEPLSYYAMLRLQEDLSNSASVERNARFGGLYARYSEASSFIYPEIMAIDEKTMATYLENDLLKDEKIALQKLLHFKNHTLNSDQEALLAPLSEIFSTPDDAFSALTDSDMEFGQIETEEGLKNLSQASFSTFLKNPNRKVREQAYKAFYGQYNLHKNSLAALYGGSVKQDIYLAKVKGFANARQKALFADKVDPLVYDNLVNTVRSALPTLHRYYELRKKLLKVDELRHYDLHVPLFSRGDTTFTYNQAVELIAVALQPLGNDYVQTMKNGLLGGWVDKYENKGKSSGAFSAGSYFGNPYILMNYKEDDIRSLFTLAHEAGHSMHSYYSVQNNPFQHYNYTIFEAEVASTFNEALVFDHLMKTTTSEELKKSLLSSRIDDMLATLFRQTMFAEFEHKIHTAIEEGAGANLNLFRDTYGQLLKDYFGSILVFEAESNLEGLRIPHFYRAFYVYKYATGISASLALSNLVLNGGESEKQNYLAFLKSGGSQWPLESLKLGGVDMSSPEPIQSATALFGDLVHTISEII